MSNDCQDIFEQYQTSGQMADLNRALECWREVLDLTPSDSSDRPALLNNLGTVLYERYVRTRELTDLEAAISAFQQVVQATPPDSPDLSIGLNNLSGVLFNRYVYIGALTDLEAAISALQQAIQATPSDSPRRPALLRNVGLGLIERYNHIGDLADLQAAIAAFQQAIQMTPSDSPDRLKYLNNLGGALYDRYQHTGTLVDLEAAISTFQQVIQVTPSDSPDWPGYLSNLGLGLLEKHKHTGGRTDLETAISAFQQAVQATPPDSPDRPARLSNLGIGLGERYARMGHLDDLEAAINSFQQAAQRTPPHSPGRPLYLSNLSLALHDRYVCIGDLADLEAAISTSQQAVRATPPNSPNRPGRLDNLGIGLYERYKRTGNRADLEAAITTFQEAVQTTPANSPDWPTRLNNLGIGLRDRYKRTGNLADLEAAISASQQAVQTTTPDSPAWPARMNDLGLGLRSRYEYAGNPADLEAAISAFQQVVEATPSNSPARAGYLNNLAGELYSRYIYTGELTDLEAAINASQQAVEATPSDSPDWPARMNNLGVVLRDRYIRTGELADLEAAITMWEQGWSVLHPRFVAFPVSYQLGQQRQGIGIVANLITAYLEQAKRLHPRSPCVPRQTLEIAEGSKSRLLTQLVGRGPLPLPSGLSPEMATQEQHLLTRLTDMDTLELTIYNNSVASTQKEIGHQSHFQQRQATQRELEHLWNRITCLGSEGATYVALRRGAAPTWHDLIRLSEALGPATALLSFFPIIDRSTTTDRTLLFLLRAGWRTPRAVEVLLHQNSWMDLLESFFLEIHRYDPEYPLNETWGRALSPLFTGAQRYLKGVKRLILAPAGTGHLLPWSVLIERAGWRTPDGQPLPLVTLPALNILSSLQKRKQVSSGPALIVGNPTNPEYSDLPYAEEEAAMVAKQFGTEPLLGAAATRSAVLARLPDAALIHLATHAFFDPDDPLKSGIVLADGVLTAREVLQHRLQADLLVLSACQSGQVGFLGGEELAGLSQAFLQAGVRSLLVSLWEVNDPATAALMQAFYTEWQERRADKAQALRQAMTQIQQDRQHLHWSHPYYWGAFVLVGDWD